MRRPDDIGQATVSEIEQVLRDVSDGTARDAASDSPPCPVRPSVQGDDCSE